MTSDDREYCDGCDRQFDDHELSYVEPDEHVEGFYLCRFCLALDQLPNREFLDALTNELSPGEGSAWGRGFKP